MFWRYGIFCSLFAGSIWGVFWQVIFTMIGILTLGTPLSLQIGPIFVTSTIAGIFYIFLQEKVSLKFHLFSIIMVVLFIYGLSFGEPYLEKNSKNLLSIFFL